MRLARPGHTVPAAQAKLYNTTVCYTCNSLSYKASYTYTCAKGPTIASHERGRSRHVDVLYRLCWNNGTKLNSTDQPLLQV
ncbi:hypothetical protein [Pontibacter amylolyticus]|uniref:hypothetical protein n=1 Tax=Pontibacter amylolyticus TaxID=1424080 RepID=UPI001668C634|nr:hypothetical protein [Pontibacter amylolyticus]